VSTDTEEAGVSEPEAPIDPVRKIALIVFGVAIVFFIYGMINDRLAPRTSQAYVQTYLVHVAPEVSGRVIEIAAEPDKRLEAGDVLFRIDPEEYELAAQRAEAQLQLAGQSIGASTASLSSAQAKLVEAIAKRENVRDQSARQNELIAKGVYPEARAAQVKAAMESADADVARAEADVETARYNLGPEGEKNPQIVSALADLQQARLAVARTTVFAPSEGAISNLQLSVGQVLSKGQAALTFIDVGDVWIDAEFRENNLENIKIGMPVEIAFDIRPGRIYNGHVSGFGYGISNRSVDARTGLPTIHNQSGWVRDPQRMPVRVVLDDKIRPGSLRYGSQATVVVYTSGNFVVNAIAWLQMRFLTVLSYVS
jgi:multidrug resistance efflux pump